MSWKFLQLEPNLFREDERTDTHMNKLTVSFRNFANAPKSAKYIKYNNLYFGAESL